MARYLQILLPLLLIAVTGGCDTYEQDEYEREIIVEAYLVAGELLPTVEVSAAAPLDARYEFDRFAIEEAAVSISLLDESGSVAERYPYEPMQTGIYAPVEIALVQPLRRYALEVSAPGWGEEVRATTLVPGSFEVLTTRTDTATYQADEQFEALVTRSNYPDRQMIFVFTVEALDTVNHDLTPLYQGVIDNEFENENGERITRSDFAVSTFGLTNEANFVDHGDDTVTLRLPWSLLAFYGPNRIVVNAVDDNIVDFLRRGTAGTTSPGELHNRLDRVDGGRGIFGSMARQTIDIYLAPR